MKTGLSFKSRYWGMPLKDNFGPTVVSDRRGYDRGRKGEILTTNIGLMDVSECNTVRKKYLKACTIILT